MREIRYKNLLSPVKIGNLTLRNRMAVTLSNPHFVQGPESWPTEALISNYANKARSGAGLVACKANNATLNTYNEDSHTQPLNIYPARNQHYFVQVSDQIHYYGAKASMMVMPFMDKILGYDASTGLLSGFVAGDGSVRKTGKEAPRELLYDVAEQYGREAKLVRELGFDMCLVDMAYRLMFPARFLSPLTNRRTDEFGGSLENRARFPLLICQAIKDFAGKDFPVELIISGEETSLYDGGTTIADTVEFARLAQGKADVLQIRACEIDYAGVPSVLPHVMPTYDMTAAVRAGIARENIDMKICMVGGCHEPEAADKLIADGVCDIVGSARSWFADPEYGKKVYEGRADDIVPCIRCNKCHVPKAGHWLTACSVNPVIGLEHKIERMVTPPQGRKRIAVVGGGVAGMEAALISAGRGYDVTLYEKSGRLGGLLNANDGMALKWTLLKFRDYMVRQTEKSGVRLMMNTEATPELLLKEDYDAVIVSVGSRPAIPPIPGVDGKNVYNAVEAAAKEPEAGEKVVIVGGGDVGVELGIHYARKGHDVTVLEMRETLAADAPPIHFYTLLREAWEKEPRFHALTGAVCTGIYGDRVGYRDAGGNEQSIEADHVILAAGMKANTDEALKFYGVGANVHLVGDCCGAGSVQSAMRSAFAAASNL